jgi:hypothetical protein
MKRLNIFMPNAKKLTIYGMNLDLLSINGFYACRPSFVKN